MATATISARIEGETLKRLVKLSAATNRSKAYLTAIAIEQYVEEQSWQIAAIQEGIRDADKGNFASATEKKAALKKWGVSGR